MKQCYDKQRDALNSFDDTKSQYSGALTAYASKAMCEEKVLACSLIYTKEEYVSQCSSIRDIQQLKTNPNCGLATLRSFVDAVDNVRVAEGCEAGLDSYTKDLCKVAPGDADHVWPWGCRLLTPTDLESNLTQHAETYCKNPSESSQELSKDVEDKVSKFRDVIYENLNIALENECEKEHGKWADKDNKAVVLEKMKLTETNVKHVESFLTKVFGGKINTEWGLCVKSSERDACEIQNLFSSGHAIYNSSDNTCSLDAEWAKAKCTEIVGGLWKAAGNYCLYMPQ